MEEYEEGRTKACWEYTFITRLYFKDNATRKQQKHVHFRDSIPWYKNTSCSNQHSKVSVTCDFTTRQQKTTTHGWLHHAHCSQCSTQKPKTTQEQQWEDSNMKQKQLVITKTEQQEETYNKWSSLLISASISFCE